MPNISVKGVTMPFCACKGVFACWYRAFLVRLTAMFGEQKVPANFKEERK